MDIIHETAELSGYKIVVAPSHFVTNPATVKNITSFVTHGGTVILTPRTDVEFFVPMGDNCEVDRLTLTNETDMEKQFTVFSYLEFCLWNAVDDSTNFQRNFSDHKLAQPLMEHLRCSYQYTLNHRGPHSLPLIGRADWNDCLNLNCFSKTPGESLQTSGPSEGPVAESVFIGGVFVKYANEYADLCNAIGKAAEAAEARVEAQKMSKTILGPGWDGAWFRRAYDAFGDPVKALASVKEKLDTKYGIVLLQPAYTRYHEKLGEITSYPPGYKENAGIFCHNNPWVSCAETVVGHGDRAFEIYKRPARLTSRISAKFIVPSRMCTARWWRAETLPLTARAKTVG